MTRQRRQTIGQIFSVGVGFGYFIFLLMGIPHPKSLLLLKPVLIERYTKSSMETCPKSPPQTAAIGNIEHWVQMASPSIVRTTVMDGTLTTWMWLSSRSADCGWLDHLIAIHG